MDYFRSGIAGEGEWGEEAGLNSRAWAKHGRKTAARHPGRQQGTDHQVPQDVRVARFHFRDAGRADADPSAARG